MPRITPLNLDDAPDAAKPLLEPLQRATGRVSNFYGTLAHAPAALDGFLALKKSLAKGALTPTEREALAVRVAERNACEYCRLAHEGALRKLAPALDLDAVRAGAPAEPRLRALLALADALVSTRGAVPDEALAAARAEGLTDEDVVETVAHVALNVLTNYLNRAAGTELDAASTAAAPAAPRSA